MTPSADSLNPALWPYLPTLTRLALSVALGLFVGLERERRGKEAGVRTFAFAALFGAMGGLLGDAYALINLELLGILIVFLNWQRLTTQKTAELTTSVALLVVGFAGVLCGKGHAFTPTAIAVITAALLSWKEPLTGFSLGLTDTELRSAILLAILTFVIYPILPARPLDPWGLAEPRATWLIIILIAALGFANYILWKLYGARGIQWGAFLGGLVNSTVAVTELASRLRESGEALLDTVYHGVLLATAAMFLRNLLILGLLAYRVFFAGLAPLGFMLAASVGFSFHRKTPNVKGAREMPPLRLASPFSLVSALKFGLIFLALQIVGTLAERFFGSWGFYAVSVIGGFISSASSVASAATLANHHEISAYVAGNGAALASISSAVINLPLVANISGRKELTKILLPSLILTIALGVCGWGGRDLFLALAKR